MSPTISPWQHCRELCHVLSRECQLLDLKASSKALFLPITSLCWPVGSNLVVDRFTYFLLAGWRPLGNSSPVVAEKVNVGSNGRGYYHGFPVIYPTGSTGSPQYRYPTHNPQEIHKSESMVDTYNDIVKQLTDNRLAANRPERLIDMTLQEVCCPASPDSLLNHSMI